MKKEKFLEWEQICKESWTLIAETGCKKDGILVLKNFLHECPACELAKLTERTIHRGADTQNCIYCPINVWRRKAIKDPSSEALCENHGELYWRARWHPDGTVRRKAALAISKLKWSFLAIYKDI